MVVGTERVQCAVLADGMILGFHQRQVGNGRENARNLVRILVRVETIRSVCLDQKVNDGNVSW